MNPWINVKNGLPRPSTVCLVKRKCRAGAEPVIVARYCKGFDGKEAWLTVPGNWNVAVTHWLELPELPET
jgi:hypothetical protein